MMSKQVLQFAPVVRRSVTNRLRHDEAWRIAADETGWTSTQIDYVLDRIAFAEAQCRIERVTA
jgi:hypothetical protein